MASHSELLKEAKRMQLLQLRDASDHSKQLISIITNILRSNSVNASTPLLDKITTIHQLDKNIDSQLQNDVALNMKDLMRIKLEVRQLISSCQKILDEGNFTVLLQRRAELVDQELRICEYTLRAIDEDIN